MICKGYRIIPFFVEGKIFCIDIEEGRQCRGGTSWRNVGVIAERVDESSSCKSHKGRGGDKQPREEREKKERRRGERAIDGPSVSIYSM